MLRCSAAAVPSTPSGFTCSTAYLRLTGTPPSRAHLFRPGPRLRPLGRARPARHDLRPTGGCCGKAGVEGRRFESATVASSSRRRPGGSTLVRRNGARAPTDRIRRKRLDRTDGRGRVPTTLEYRGSAVSRSQGPQVPSGQNWPLPFVSEGPPSSPERTQALRPLSARSGPLDQLHPQPRHMSILALARRSHRSQHRGREYGERLAFSAAGRLAGRSGTQCRVFGRKPIPTIVRTRREAVLHDPLAWRALKLVDDAHITWDLIRGEPFG